MPFAISLKSVNATAEPLRALWRDAGRLEDEPSMEALDYPPHMTLAIYDEVEPERLGDIVRRLSAGRAPLRIAFERLRHFEGAPLVLWAAPRPSAELAALHAAVHGEIPPERCRPHYRPDQWVPHCTLAMRVPETRRAETLAWLRQPRTAFTVLFDRIDCVTFYPVNVIEDRPLV